MCRSYHRYAFRRKMSCGVEKGENGDAEKRSRKGRSKQGMGSMGNVISSEYNSS